MVFGIPANRDIGAVILSGNLRYPLHAGLSVNSGIEARREVKVPPTPIVGRSPAAMMIKANAAVQEPRNPPAAYAEEESKITGLPGQVPRQTSFLTQLRRGILQWGYTADGWKE